ncbi:39S ribosomal protein L53/MRP-L53-domain-containing protein [Lineolata rhizophorae]|uniref:Large ribosomal subunit protein mL53 n=1 Tax=Lineolata rhizophorae TaxID=578093 RepID=A0A6A6P7B8_9PEZI|nr:39S ribosomal protein L53/MRP-L53-domain-containing protein [Lineolata rhizophorae]
MITRYITAVSVRFNPFRPRSKAARSFLALLPPDARAAMKVEAAVLPRASAEPPVLNLKFKDGKEMNMDLRQVKIGDIVEEVDRHSRMLGRQEELSSA